MSTEDEVRRASETFYAALNDMANGDARQLAEIWSHGGSVTTMHPIGGREVGWDQVRGSWEQVAKVASEGEVRLTDQLIEVVGDMAYEVGTEQGKAKFNGQPVSINHRVTNIYRRESGTWKVVHHHTDVSAEMLRVLRR